MKKSLGKRLLSGITSAALVVSYMIPSGLTLGGGMLSNAGESLGGGSAVDDVTLLVGTNPVDPSGNPYGTFSSVDEAISQYDRDYALGIASQFCVFVSENFSPTRSDAEGRVVVGGNIYTDLQDQTVYNIGKGDYITNKSLDEVLGNSEYAHIIWGANSPELSFPSQIYGDFKPRTVVQTQAGAEYISANLSAEKDNFYQTELLNVEAEIGKIKTKSEQLSKVKNQFDMEFFDANHVHTNGMGATVATVRYNGTDTTADTVYLNLDEFTDEEYKQFKSASIIRYEDIPELETPRTVNDTSGVPQTWKYAYIVINDSREGDVLIGSQKDWLQQYTFIKGKDASEAINISSGGGVWVKQDKDGQETYAVDKENKANNDIGVTSLLYNIPNASRVVIVSSAQGTVLAPNAEIVDAKTLKKEGTLSEVGITSVNDDNPHISGAIIAKKFRGNTEIGYRP